MTFFKLLLLAVFVSVYIEIAIAGDELTPREQKIKTCSGYNSNCALCTTDEDCGYCQSFVRSGDGTSKYDVRLCLAINESTQLPLTGDQCDNWRINSCPCPNDCNDHGACGSDGVCECAYAWTGEDCGSPRPNMVKPGVIIPIAIGTAFLGAALVVSIQLFGGGARCLNRKEDLNKDEKDLLTKSEKET